GSHILCDPLRERRRQSRRTFAAPGVRPARAAKFLLSRDRTSCATRSANGGGKAAAPSPLRALRALRGRRVSSCRGIALPVRPARRTAVAEPPHLRRSGRAP